MLNQIHGRHGRSGFYPPDLPAIAEPCQIHSPCLYHGILLHLSIKWFQIDDAVRDEFAEYFCPFKKFQEPEVQEPQEQYSI